MFCITASEKTPFISHGSWESPRVPLALATFLMTYSTFKGKACLQLGKLYLKDDARDMLNCQRYWPRRPIRNINDNLAFGKITDEIKLIQTNSAPMLLPPKLFLHWGVGLCLRCVCFLTQYEQ